MGAPEVLIGIMRIRRIEIRTVIDIGHGEEAAESRMRSRSGKERIMSQRRGIGSLIVRSVARQVTQRKPRKSYYERQGGIVVRGFLRTGDVRARGEPKDSVES